LSLTAATGKLLEVTAPAAWHQPGAVAPAHPVEAGGQTSRCRHL
jgi:hypothetical protein